MERHERDAIHTIHTREEAKFFVVSGALKVAHPAEPSGSARDAIENGYSTQAEESVQYARTTAVAAAASSNSTASSSMDSTRLASEERLKQPPRS